IVDVHAAKRGVALPVGAAPVAGPQLAPLEEVADLRPAHHFPGIDRLEPPGWPDHVVAEVVVAEDVERGRLRDRPLDRRVALGALEREREAEVLLRLPPDRIELVDPDAQHVQGAPKAAVRIVVGCRRRRSSDERGKADASCAPANEKVAASEAVDGRARHLTCTVVQTPPSPAARWSGCGPTRIVATTRPCFGSIRETVPSV